MGHKTQTRNKVHSFVRKREQPIQPCLNHSALELIVEVTNYNIVPKMKTTSKYFGNVWKNKVWVTFSYDNKSFQHGILSVIHHLLWNTVGRFLLACAYSMQHIIYQTFTATLPSQQCLWLSEVKCIFKDKLHVNLKWSHELTAHFWEYTH